MPLLMLYVKEEILLWYKSVYDVMGYKCLWIAVKSVINKFGGPKSIIKLFNNNLMHHYMLCIDFAYCADRLIPCGVIIYTVTSTSP